MDKTPEEQAAIVASHLREHSDGVVIKRFECLQEGIVAAYQPQQDAYALVRYDLSQGETDPPAIERMIVARGEFELILTDVETRNRAANAALAEVLVSEVEMFLEGAQS